LLSRQQWIALLVAGGVLGGVAFVLLSPKLWSRIGASVAGSGARLLRSSVVPALLTALIAKPKALIGAAADAGQSMARAV
jgi:hypothetical protein